MRSIDSCLPQPVQRGRVRYISTIINLDFGLTAEQELLRDTARAFVARTCPPEVAKEWDDSETPPTQLNAAFAAMDWFGLPFPEEYGGAGATPL